MVIPTIFLPVKLSGRKSGGKVGKSQKYGNFREKLLSMLKIGMNPAKTRPPAKTAVKIGPSGKHVDPS